MVIIWVMSMVRVPLGVVWCYGQSTRTFRVRIRVRFGLGL